MFDAGFELEFERHSDVLEDGFAVSEHAKVSSKFTINDIAIAAPEGWCGVLGAKLPSGTEINLRLTGKQDAPVIAVLGGISSSRFVANTSDNEGWWPQIAGVGAAIDLNAFRVAGFDFVAGDGETPLDLTPADEAALFAYALSEAGVDCLHTFVGASFGGMVALSFARQFPVRVDKLVVVCAAHRPSPMAQAWRTVQRQVLSFAIENGHPEEGVALARSLAMTTYRTASEFDKRFSCSERADGGVADYLSARGDAYVNQTTAARYLTLSNAIDRHFENPEEVMIPALIIGADSDQIVPFKDVEELAERFGGKADLVRISSLYGHDAFLKETAVIAPHIHNFIS